jgi:hypothetical protein
VFSLAAVMHEMLWGRRVAGTGAQTAAWRCALPGGDLEELRAVFGRGLADDPADRFETALAFVDALKEAFVAGAASRPPRVSRAMATAEPRLPLDEPLLEEEQIEIDPVRAVVEEPAIHEDDDLDLRSPEALRDAEDARYVDVEAAPAIVADFEPEPPVEAAPPITVEPVHEAPLEPPPPEPPPPESSPALEAPRLLELPEEPLAAPVQMAREAERGPEPPAAMFASERLAEHARSAMWPLVLALVVGLALGFAGGYGVGIREHTESAPAAAASPAAANAPAAPSAATPGAMPKATDGTAFTEEKIPAPAPAPAETAPRPAAAPATPAAEATGRLLVRSTPAGATVFVDGRERGRTPLALRGLDHGTHAVRVSRDGYVAQERRVALTRARPSQAMTLTLIRERAPRAASAESAAERFTGALVVESRPAGATVYVDGRRAGTTPLSVTGMRAGEHAVRLDLPGYRRWTASVRVVAGEHNRVTASLER